MDIIMQIAKKYGVKVVEDNAHGLFGRYNGQYLGTFGSLGTQSFHETKNIICGEGGALIVNDLSYLDRAEILREKGTNRSRFFRGQVDKYSWVDVGSSYLPSDILAAFLCAQLEKREEIQARRCQIWHYYHAHLSDWAESHAVGLPFSPPHCEQTYHMFYMLMPSFQLRQNLIAHLKGRGILAVFHYVPLHLSEMGRRVGGIPGQCPVTERVSDCLIRLPFYRDLSDDELAEVVAAVLEFQFNA
jgi:dTDP-4-amino-4,6-dideoxygalactose transaminase